MDDRISRAAAVRIIADMHGLCRDDVLRESIQAIKELPAVDDMPVVHGEWKWSHGGECSECGFHNSNYDYRYCPMCGAKMDG